MKKEKFNFKYIAPTKEERREIEEIRNSYLQDNNHNKNLEMLKKLDTKVKNIPNTFAIIFGIIGTLVFGLAMSMVLEWNIILWGILVGIVGCVLIGLAYPIYISLSKKLKKKYGDEILRISSILLNETDSKNNDGTEIEDEKEEKTE